MRLKDELKQNPESKICFILFLFWTAKEYSNKKNLLLRIFGRIVGSIYAFITYWIMGIDISYQTQIGEDFKLSHGIGIVINPASIIGKNVWIRQNTTIGNDLKSHKAPIIGDNVNIGANVCIIGDITIGNNCIVGAGSIVTKSMPPNSVIVGNPAKVIRTIE